MSTDTDASTPQVDAASQQSERFFRTLVENSADVIALVNAEGTITYVSPSITRVMGYSPEEFLGSHALVIVHPDDLERMQQVLGSVLQSPGKSLSAEYRLRCKDGSWRWFESTATNLLADPGVQAIVGNFRDISDRKQAEEQLSYHASIAQSISDVVVATDNEYRILSWNNAAEMAFGWKEEEVLGKVATDLLPIVYIHGSREEWQAQLATKGYWKGEVIQHRRDGTPMYALVSVSTVKDRFGNVLGAVTVSRDITERKLAEQRKDDFISMVSHELKTPVTSIKGFTQLLHRRFQQRDDEVSLSFLARMDGQLTKLTKLINELLDISKMQSGQLVYAEERFYLDQFVAEIVENVQTTTQSHRLIVEGSTGAQVLGDRDRIGQVLINLLANAIKYSPGADQVLIRLTKADDEVIVSVQDAGIGIASEHHQKIFERFYQVTDPMEKTFPGLGIGLYISSEIIKRHAGRIWLESQKGKGSTFSFSLPCAS